MMNMNSFFIRKPSDASEKSAAHTMEKPCSPAHVLRFEEK